MKNKLFALVLAAVMLLSVACGASAMTAGTYTKTVGAMHGPMTLEVVLTGDRIESVKVLEHVETPGVGDQAVLLQYTGSETEVSVPETLGGCPVTNVRARAFSELEVLREVRFPETVEAFAGFLFADCPQLEAVWFPASARIVDIFAMGTSPDPNLTAWVPAGSKARQVAEERGWNWKETPVQ